MENLRVLELCHLLVLLGAIHFSQSSGLGTDGFRVGNGAGAQDKNANVKSVYENQLQRKYLQTLRREAEEPTYVTQEEFDKTVAELKDEMNVLASMNTELATQFAALSEEQSALAASQATQGDSIRAIEAQQADERQPLPMLYARLTQTVRYDYGQTYLFPVVETHKGKGTYSNGVYTCELAGYYLVSVMLYSADLNKKGNYAVYGTLYKSGLYVTTIEAQNKMFSGSNEVVYLQATSTVIVHCATGQRLYVTGWPNGGVAGRTDRGGFTIMLIQKDS